MIIFDSKDFGLELKKRRKELGYTQSNVADVTGFSISFISDLERGKKTAELEKSIYLANMLGLDISLNKRE